MNKVFFLLLLTGSFYLTTYGQSSAEKAILKILDNQTQFWNRGDLDNFVLDYWNHDSLMFIGSSGVIYGYDNTIRRYKNTYSDTAKMGKLHFEVVHLQRLSSKYYFVVGKWFLNRSIGDINGHFSLLIRKIKGKWKIVADHSS